MPEDVSWPKASEGGKITGKEEIRAHWTRQWGEFDPHVEPLAMTEEEGGKIRVKVHQLDGKSYKLSSRHLTALHRAGRSCDEQGIQSRKS